MTYLDTNPHRIGLHIRAGLITDDPFNVMHFFSPLLSSSHGSGLASRWVSCAYANLPAGAKNAPHTWWVAADTQAAKLTAMNQVASQEGPITAHLNLGKLLASLQGQEPPEHIKVRSTSAPSRPTKRCERDYSSGHAFACHLLPLRHVGALLPGTRESS